MGYLVLNPFPINDTQKSLPWVEVFWAHVEGRQRKKMKNATTDTFICFMVYILIGRDGACTVSTKTYNYL